jgi:hypothetical protein
VRLALEPLATIFIRFHEYAHWLAYCEGFMMKKYIKFVAGIALGFLLAVYFWSRTLLSFQAAIRPMHG